MEGLKIPYEIIANESRFVGDLDDEMMTFYEFTEFNFYIRETNKFISPNTGFLPYGNLGYEYQDTKSKGYDVKKSKIPLFLFLLLRQILQK